MFYSRKDRLQQTEIVELLKTVVSLLKTQPNRKRQRPMVMTEDQIDDLAEHAAIYHGKHLTYDDES